jgi:tetratricopeptide (TPR) repeat protein
MMTLALSGTLSADESDIIQKDCVAGNAQCEDKYERHLKQKNQNRGFFRREMTKRRAYPYINRAFALVERGKIQKAIVELDKYLEADPGYDLFRWYRLVMISTQGDSTALIEAANDFIEKAETSGPALLIRGNAHIKAGNSLMAEKDFLLAKSKDLYDHAQLKDIQWILYNLAYNQSDYKKASQWLNKLPDSEKQSPKYKVMRANLYEKLEQEEKAIATWQNLLTSTDQQELKLKALTALGRLHGKRSSNTKALDYYSKVLAIEEDTSVRLDAAETAWKLKDYKKTESLLKPVISTEALEGEYGFGLRQRYCEAIDKTGEESRAAACLEDLLDDYPNQSSVLSYSADLARRKGENDVYIRKLKKLYEQNPDAKTASIIAFALDDDSKWVDAELWHEKAYSTGEKPEYAIAYSVSLLGNGNSREAIDVLQRISEDPLSTTEHREYAYNNLANLYSQQKSYIKADEAWKKASLENNKSIYTLRRIVTNNLMENYKASHQLALPFGSGLPADLPKENVMEWYAAVGQTYYKNKDYKHSQIVFEKQSAIETSADFYLLLAESYRANGEVEKSNRAYLEAERLSKKEGYTLKNRAYMYLNAGQDEKAIPLLAEIHQRHPENALIAEKLGYYSLKQNRDKEAASYFRSALDAYETTGASDSGTQLSENKRDTLTQLITKLEKRRWSFSFYDGLCVGSTACKAGSEGLISPFGQGFGQATATYQINPAATVFSRALWRNKKDSLAFEKDSFQPTLGFSLKPIKKQNLLLSLEYMFEGGLDTQNHVLIRTAWSKTHGNSWSEKEAKNFKGYKLTDYTNLYVDLGKLFLNDDPFLASAEGRKGKTAVLSKQTLFSGFGYLRGSAQFNDKAEDMRVIDAGIGIEGRYRNRYDRYRGYKTEWNMLFRVGQELENSLDKKDTRVNLGIGLRF